MVTLTFDLWTSDFQECLTLPQCVFSFDKSYYLAYLNGVMGSQNVFLSLFGHVVILTFDLKFQECITLPQLVILKDKFLPGTFERSYRFKTDFLSIFGPGMTLTFDL